jgi:hypothetical protein
MAAHLYHLDAHHGQPRLHCRLQLGVVGLGRVASDLQRLRAGLSLCCAQRSRRPWQVLDAHRLRPVATIARCSFAHLFRHLLLVIDGQRLALHRRRLLGNRWLLLSAAVGYAGRLLRAGRDAMHVHRRWWWRNDHHYL